MAVFSGTIYSYFQQCVSRGCYHKSVAITCVPDSQVQAGWWQTYLAIQITQPLQSAIQLFLFRSTANTAMKYFMFLNDW